MYLGQYAKTRMAYKADFFISLLASVLATVAGYGFVLVLFTRAPHLQGWSFDEILFIYGFSLIPMGLYNVVSLNLYEFGDAYIVEGRFDRVLLRPVHSLFQILFESFRLESVQEIVDRHRCGPVLRCPHDACTGLWRTSCSFPRWSCAEPRSTSAFSSSCRA